jgi:hypothetical protein
LGKVILENKYGRIAKGHINIRMELALLAVQGAMSEIHLIAQSEMPFSI